MDWFEMLCGTAAMGGMFYLGTKEGENRQKQTNKEKNLEDEIQKLKDIIEEMKR